jgi:UDPglucose--hexose-1-phosphate uridylyltransferase
MHRRCIYCELLENELEKRVRIIAENDGFVSVSAYAARFPFECWIIPRRHQARFEAVQDTRLRDLGSILRYTLKSIGSVIEDVSYNFMIHSSPFHIGADAYYHWHIEILPRTTNIAGFEYGTGYYINPVPPEEAAEKMRNQT